MLILKCDDVHVSAMQFFECHAHALIIINKALASGFLCCCGLLFEFYASCLGDDLAQGLHRIGTASVANGQIFRHPDRGLEA